MNIVDMASELEDAAGLDRSELGEWWTALVGLIPRVFDSASKEFRDAFENEIKSEHKRLKEEFILEEIMETAKYRILILKHKSE